MKRSARGFTLLEVIIAFALLGLALTLLLGSLSGGAKQVREAEVRTRAVLHAQSLLAEAGVTSPLQVGSQQGDWEQGRYHWELQVQPWVEPRAGNQAQTQAPGMPWLAELQLQPAPVAAGPGERAMKRGAAGCTLVEVMLATVLLAGGLALAFASVRSAMAVSQRGEQIAAESERMRAVETLLRRQLSAALRTPLEAPDPTREPIFFQGEEQRMLFAADLPGYLGRGGAYLHALQVEGRSGQQRLLLDLVLLQEGEHIAENPPRPPEVLVDNLKSVQLRYRGFDASTGQVTDWMPRWDDTRRLPMLVEIQIVPAKGTPWPALPGAGRGAGAGAVADRTDDGAGGSVRAERACRAPAAAGTRWRRAGPGTRTRGHGICADAPVRRPAAGTLARRWPHLSLAVR
ncbi:hypothetical protein G6F65_015174 [Rhizopus arrhizus]|nr:hypothetical protein G6F65_015174 [Rhizopus arrhizus]